MIKRIGAKIMEQIQNYPGARRGPKPVEHINVTNKKTWPIIGEKVLVTQVNHPWHNFRVIIMDVSAGWANCQYGSEVRAISIKSLSRYAHGFQKDFIYDRQI